MSASKKVVIIAAGLILAGCAANPKPIIDKQGVNEEIFAQDWAECEAYSEEIEIGKGIAKGTATGAAVGGVAGAIDGDVAKGAAYGGSLRRNTLRPRCRPRQADGVQALHARPRIPRPELVPEDRRSGS